MASIKSPLYPLEVDVRDDGIPSHDADAELVRRGHPPMRWSESGPIDARARAVPIGVRCVQGHTRAVAAQDSAPRKPNQWNDVDDTPPWVLLERTGLLVDGLILSSLTYVAHHASWSALHGIMATGLSPYGAGEEWS